MYMYIIQCESMVCCVLQDEVVHTSQGILPVKPDHSSSSAEKFAHTCLKTVELTPDSELVEVKTCKKQKQSKNSLMELLQRSRKDSVDDEELEQVRFLELLALNLPDWYLVLLGVICAALLGSFYPFMAVIFSGFLEVGVHST